jgi:hypothetical protein
MLERRKAHVVDVIRRLLVPDEQAPKTTRRSRKIAR